MKDHRNLCDTYDPLPAQGYEILEKNAEKKAHKYHDIIVPAMKALRAPVDELEQIVDKDLWPYPSYGDLIFEVSEP
jgi:glutamine synthetase